jgi:hypothetical protein
MEMRAQKWLLRLYVAGSRGVSAQEHDVVAVPMVVRESPVPIRKVVGDLSNAERALFALRLGAFDV